LTVENVISAFALPSGSLVNQRIPKKLLVENGGVTAADRRRLTDGIAEVTWSAVLKPETAGVPAYRDDHRDYLEISVVTAALRPGGSPVRIHELVHRAIPYPVVLVTEQDSALSLSLAHKRHALNEPGKTVLDGDPESVTLTGAPFVSELLSAVALSGQSRAHLLALYQSWLDLLTAFQAARLTGSFSKEPTSARSETRRAALRECVRIESEITRLTAEASREKQLPKRVELNLRIQKLRANLNETKGLL